jgi:hypothetical protein
MGLQLSVDRGEIRQWVNATAGRLGALAEEQFVEFLVAEIIWQRPRELGGLGQFQVRRPIKNTACADRQPAVRVHPVCFSPKSIPLPGVRQRPLSIT